MEEEDKREAEKILQILEKQKSDDLKKPVNLIILITNNLFERKKMPEESTKSAKK